jgi:hypothetical protein
MNRLVTLNAVADYLSFGIPSVVRQPTMRGGGYFLVEGTSATVQKNMALFHDHSSQSSNELAA